VSQSAANPTPFLPHDLHRFAMQEQQDPTLLSAFITDVANGLWSPDELAARHGFDSVAAMREFLKRPPVFRMVKQARAVWSSAAGTNARISEKAKLLVEDNIGKISRLAMDPGVPAPVRVASLNMLEKLCNFPRPAPGGGTAVAASNLSINITIDGKTESFTGAPTIEGQPDSPTITAIETDQSYSEADFEGAEES
jgi:hypothetical protein